MKAGWSPATVVDLTGVASLGGWERAKGRGLRIGAVARLSDLEADDRHARSLPIVRAALRVEGDDGGRDVDSTRKGLHGRAQGRGTQQGHVTLVVEDDGLPPSARGQPDRHIVG